MTIREWIRDREIGGFPTFSVDDVRQTFPDYSEQVIKNELFRLSKQGILCPVYKGFYVIIPPQYAAKRMVPPIYYIDQLMSYLNKPYYICLLNAAEILGAAHQRPQKFSVMTVFPKSSVSSSKNNSLVWGYRKEIPSDFLLFKNSETGVIYYSNAELTAIDIVHYEQYIGGLSRAATILDELAEKLDFRKASDNLFNYTSIATIQRLGYILDDILEQKEIAEVLHSELLTYVKRFRYIPLSTHKTDDNAEVEQDLIISRALVAIFSDKFLASQLAFRGGTALHKLYLSPQPRYSEDIDLVQITPGPIKPIMFKLGEVLSFLPDRVTKQKRYNNTMLFRMESEIPPTIPLRLKIEINCFEHFNELGKCEITTYRLNELLGTKLRALYQRKKGRDLFDLYVALSEAVVDINEILRCYNRYMSFVVQQPPTYKQFINNMEEKMLDPDFLGDTQNLIRPDREFNPRLGYELVLEKLIERMRK